MQPAPTPRIALVTGASRGLGFALAAALGARGFHVVAVARTVGGLEELDDRIRTAGGSATLAPLDVTDDGAMRHLCRSVHDRWGAVAVWAHTAIHAPPLAPAGHIDPRDWTKALDVNLRATGLMIPMVEPLLRAGGGTALFLDDPRAGTRFFGAYGATKGGQIALARSWADETARTGPRVVILEPRPMPTALRARFYPGEDRAALADPHAEAARLLAEALPG